MNYTFKMIRRVAGKNIKSLYLPIVLSCLDALLHMGMFSAMVLTIIELIGGIFTVQKLTLYSVILVLLFLVRAILFSVNYTQVSISRRRYFGAAAPCSRRSYPQPESWIFQQEQHRPPHEYADYGYY